MGIITNKISQPRISDYLKQNSEPTEQALSSEVKEKILVDDQDQEFFLSNVAKLGFEGLMLYAEANYGWLVTVPWLLSALYQQSVAVQNTNPEKSGFEKLTSHPCFSIMSLGALPFINRVHSFATMGVFGAKVLSISLLSGVLRKSIPKCFSSLKEIRKRPLAALGAAALHLFNAGSQVYTTTQLFAYLDVPDSVRNAAQEVGLSPDASCKEINQKYKKLALELHPDKTKAPDAATKFAGMTAAIEALKTWNKC